MSTGEPAPPQRSTFITALAWIFIVLAGFATLVSALQNVMITLMFPASEMQAAADRATNDERMPWFAAFMFQNIRLFFFALFVLCVGTLTAAIGLLKRRNWARLLFIGLMGFGILWNIGGVVFSIVFFSSMPPIPATASREFGDQFELMFYVMIGFNVVLAVAFTALFGWILKRLFSIDIRREFSAV